MIEGVTHANAIPVLERLVQFAGKRHRVIAHNIANLTTPGFRPADLPVDRFRSQLAAAVDERRASHGASGGELQLGATEAQSRRLLSPEPIGDNLLFHDRNDRDLERTMQSLVENFMTFRSAAELLASRFRLLDIAISQRV